MLKFEDPLIIEERQQGDGRLVLSLYGDLDLATAPELARRLQEAAADAQAIEIDLQGVEFIDVHGLRALLGTATGPAAARRSAVIGPDPSACVRRLAELVSANLWPAAGGATRWSAGPASPAV